MKRFALLVLSFLIIAVFDWLFVSALLASGAESAPVAVAQSSQWDVPEVFPSPLSPQSTPSPAPDESSSQMLEIPVPETFAGCWSNHPERAMASHYTLCFKRFGVSDWRVTAAGLSNAGVSRWSSCRYAYSAALADFGGKYGWSAPNRVDVLYKLNAFCGSNAASAAVALICIFENDGTLQVEGIPEIQADGKVQKQPWWSVTFYKDAGGDEDGNGSVDGALAR